MCLFVVIIVKYVSSLFVEGVEKREGEWEGLEVGKGWGERRKGRVKCLEKGEG